ncbi:CPBP family intramembrane metalloprotease [Alphaproteobacteria bacterium GH1-50]|uniref:CPBP family intramembrane metalloprotease n=1 Tax=Kangsaoukella pontilimi TaxID=2691042 RepID=A0A7C9MGY6_9RHOB|nr:CPBP family intramembrane glutamic endopeptidase [Kangsaoukella pontilimi]MXQ08656.1 CPBP family intramembrane metalloprotease [Kangsaoukella pontilimi]
MTDSGWARIGRGRLWVEFVLFFIVAPLAVAVLLPPRWMFPALFTVTGVGLILLFLTPGFRLLLLTRGLLRMSTPLVVMTALVTLAVGYGIMQATRPEALWMIVRRNPELMAMIALGYPVVSALPQEVVFRVLFFERYAPILPSRIAPQIVLNANIFALAHVMYWSWIVLALTFAGGLLFAWSYRVRGNFPEAVVLHSVAGVALFLLGMGVYFYSGNVQRPF